MVQTNSITGTNKRCVCVEGAGIRVPETLKALCLELETRRKWLLLKSLQGSALCKTTLTLSDPFCDLPDLTVALYTQTSHKTCKRRGETFRVCAAVHSVWKQLQKSRTGPTERRESNCKFFIGYSYAQIFFAIREQFTQKFNLQTLNETNN